MKNDNQAIQRVDQLITDTNSATSIADFEAIVEKGIFLYNEKNISMSWSFSY